MTSSFQSFSEVSWLTPGSLIRERIDKNLQPLMFGLVIGNTGHELVVLLVVKASSLKIQKLITYKGSRDIQLVTRAFAPT